MKRSFQRKSWFILLSVLMHSSFLLLSWTSSQLEKFLRSDEDTFIEVTFVDSQELSKLQIVEQDEISTNEVAPEDAKFLSAKNQKVAKETKAENAGVFNNLVGANGNAKNKKQKAKLPSLKDLNPGLDWYAEKEEAVEEVQAGRGPAKTLDYLKDVDSGAQTLLNAREFVYYSYYNRIRNQLQQYWEPSIKARFLKLVRAGRAIASTGDKLTKVLITLNQQGNLVKVQVLEESGVRDLDEAAVEAFQQAAPFPNPPSGIVEKDGTIKIRWDFIVEA